MIYSRRSRSAARIFDPLLTAIWIGWALVIVRVVGLMQHVRLDHALLAHILGSAPGMVLNIALLYVLIGARRRANPHLIGA